MPDPSPSAPDAAAARSWVWHATVESRDAGKVSVLACVETLFAVALYWWIAIRWDTHWPLLTSVFIAPLLLLRSPESMKLGVRWFAKDWWGFEDYEKWPRGRRLLWLIGVVVLTGIATYALTRWLCGLWLVGQAGWTLFGWSALIGGLSLVFAFLFAIAVVIAFAGTVGFEFTDFVTCAFAGAGIGGGVVAGWGVAAGWGAMTGAIAVVIAVLVSGEGAAAGVGVGVGVGLSLRGLVFRVAATLRHLPQGLRPLAGNWQENNFWVDSCVPAELLPGIREEYNEYAFERLVWRIRQEKKLIWRWGGWPLIATFFFLPAFLYRLNIKATCWFWWPLAYLLKPVPKADKASAQKQALCWPWDNPLQMLLILVPGVLVLGLLIMENCDFSVWKELKNAAAVPIPLKVALSMRWGHIPPWNWALIIIEVTGLLMLAIAGKARAHRASENWDDYAQSGMIRDLWLMDKLMRLRSLAAKAFMVLGLGMCLISFPEWRQHLPGPLLQRLERFYHAEKLRVA